MNNALDLAKYIVAKCVADKQPITNVRLQKILYYIQKISIERGSEAFYDSFEFWGRGPVIPDVYYYYGGYGVMPITEADNTLYIPPNKAMVDRITEMMRGLEPWDVNRLLE